MACCVHRHPSHPRIIFVHGRDGALVMADLDRALLGWPLVVSLITTFGTAGFVLLSAGERVFDLRAAAASLLTLWRVVAAVVFLPGSTTDAGARIRFHRLNRLSGLPKNQSLSPALNRSYGPYCTTIFFVCVLTPPFVFCAVTVITLSPCGSGGV